MILGQQQTRLEQFFNSANRSVRSVSQPRSFKSTRLAQAVQGLRHKPPVTPKVGAKDASKVASKGKASTIATKALATTAATTTTTSVSAVADTGNRKKPTRRGHRSLKSKR